MKVLLALLLLLSTTLYGEIKAVMFDYGGVMYNDDHHNLNELLERTMGHSFSQFLRCIPMKTWHKLSRGELTERDFWQKVARQCRRRLPPNFGTLFKEAYAKDIVAIPGMLAIVEDLQARGYQTAMLTNITPWPAQIIAQEGYYKPFHPLMASAWIGHRKPEKKAYRYALAQLQLQPDEVVFIDNKMINVEAANRLGIHALHFTTPETLVAQLQELGVDLQ